MAETRIDLENALSAAAVSPVVVDLADSGALGAAVTSVTSLNGS